MIRILLLEDSEVYFKQTRQLMIDNPEIAIHWAKDYSSALGHLEQFSTEIDDRTGLPVNTKFDGAILDVFVPSGDCHDPEGHEVPYGLTVAGLCEKAGIPFVFCSSRYHHDKELEWFYRLCRAKDWVLVDTSPQDGDAEEKDWMGAFSALEELVTQ